MNSLLQMSHPAATQPAPEAGYPVLSTAFPQLNISLVPLTFSTQIAVRAIFAFLRRVINPLKTSKVPPFKKRKSEQNAAYSHLDARRLLQSVTE
jgi:hypothetical protein